MKHLGNVCGISGFDVEPVDIVTFGSPCQDLSIAGKRAGLKHEENGDDETTRSGLFMEAIRIIKEMREATNGEYPKFAIWENVMGAFSSNKGEDFRIVLEEFVKICEPAAVMPPVPEDGWAYADCYCGDGWSLAYRVFDAQYWGVAQRRRRCYALLDLTGERAAEILFERDGLRGYFTENGTPWQSFTSHSTESVGTDNCSSEEERYISNIDDFPRASLPLTYDARGNGDGYTVNTITGDHENRITDYTSIVVDCYGIGNGQANQSFMHESAGTLNCMHDQQAVAIVYGVDCRNGALNEEVYPTLQAKPNGGQSLNYSGALCVDYVVRRLTPVECARLQGFPMVIEVDTADMTRDELISIALSSGYIIADIENGKVFGTRGPGGVKLDKPIELHGSNVNGYTVYSIHVDGVKKQVRAHRVIWIAAHGAIPEGMVVDHINSDKTDNRISNLQLLTPQQNSTKAREDGRYLVGENNPQTKISDREKRALYFLYWNTDKPYSYYAKKFGISDSRAQQIIHEHQWGEIDQISEWTYTDHVFWSDVRNTHAVINGKEPKEYSEKQMQSWYNKLHTDTAEYRLWGNGIALPCALYVMQGIADTYED